ncbi:hypothetical protein V9T40_004909 [Parthenolecanium corni]|uniref:DNA mismatch repair protein S5 domain-containing protein n=1 Tax=Parthenolecanium corni TaxID=536013 RepID=A0AAN9TEQ6_9HEMI
MSNSAIMSIGGEAIHKIYSGQVVLSLAVALKDLLENSLDAGASAVDIRLREYGSELIEVVDNDIGIHPNNSEALALKHYTYILRDFSELEGIATFGFRGEGLSSLCAVGESTVPPTSGHNSYLNQSVLLPARSSERIPSKFGKRILQSHTLSSYCLISANVKISCVNQTKKGRTTFLCTQNDSTIRGNISCVLGPKQLSTLLEIVMTFIFINSRPCDLSKVIKLTNEIYHRYNAHQYPFVLLNILLPKQSVDVNVTPDERLKGR